MKVFLGGTCAESKWREKLIPLLKCDYFNPVVKDWTPECQQIEENEKMGCNYHLYVITPKMKGMFSIAEAVNDSKELQQGCCVFCVTKEEDDRDWDESERRSLNAVSNMIANNGGRVFNNLDDVVKYLNGIYDMLNTPQSTEQQLEYYKKRTEHLMKLWNTLIEHILPKGWYCMANDTWDCEEEELQSCVGRLHRPFVQWLIKRGNKLE